MKVAVHVFLFLLSSGWEQARLQVWILTNLMDTTDTAKPSAFTDDLRRSGDPSPAKTWLKKKTFAVKGYPRLLHLSPKRTLHPSFRAATTHTASLYKLILRDGKSLSASLENVFSQHRLK